ncbi:MAG: DNA-processing protein DprA, partial [bacterium]|nr:DNA-processing protein DprA [bacterium]
DIFENCLAVVGSRHLTSYGKRITEQLVTEIAGAGITIVSGFMYGGDEAAHSATVRAGGRTIAVMPCGINIIHPAYQEKLYNDILKGRPGGHPGHPGLIISEYEGDFLPQTWSYVQRNRIVAGLSKAILVVEAGLNSGSLITAALAKRYSRKIFAVPGQITSEVSKGTIKLIKEGAEVVTEARDILSFYKVLVNESSGSPSSATFARLSSGSPSSATFARFGALEQKIIEQLKREPMEADTIARTLGMSVAKIGTTLSLMQLKGFINQESGKYYIN